MPTSTHTKERGSAWCVVINNPTKSDDDNMSQARQKGWKVEGQLEKAPTTGTPHYQLIVRTPQVRFSAVKAQFPRARIELARNVDALANYSVKEETRIGELPKTNSMYPNLQQMWDMFYEFMIPYMEVDRIEKYSPEERLAKFDLFIGEAITKGYVVETMGVNPQMRSCVKLYLLDILARSKQRRQTDRQTAEIVIPTYDINESQVQETTSEAREESASETIGTCEGSSDTDASS